MTNLLDLGTVFWLHWSSDRDTLSAVEGTAGRIAEQGRLVVCADHPPYHRQAKSPSYKANRPPKPPESVECLGAVKARLQALGWPVMSSEGYEADDVIATLVARLGGPIMIHSRDKDLAQLVDERVSLWWEGSPMGPEAVEDRYGLPPTLLRDWIALAGDSADNIPGAPGIGGVAAIALLKQFGSLKGVLEAALTKPTAILQMRGFGPSRVAAIRDHVKQIDLSYQLAFLTPDVPLDMEALEEGI